jgi:hypothetical protein
MVAADYPFLDVMWTMIVFFCWILWLWLLFAIWADIFRRHDIGGLGKTGWLLFTIFLPFLGVFVYVISQSDGMTERRMGDVKAQQAQFDQYVRETAGSGGGAASEIENAKRLLDSGTINQSEFDMIKQKALTA